jgi:hypothetical protein
VAIVAVAVVVVGVASTAPRASASTGKMSIPYDATQPKWEKSSHAARQGTVRVASASLPAKLNVHATWRCYPSQYPTTNSTLS